MGALNVGPPSNTEVDKIKTATEQAYEMLIAAAKRDGMSINNGYHFADLPDTSVVIRFQHACRAVLDCLRLKA